MKPHEEEWTVDEQQTDNQRELLAVRRRRIEPGRPSLVCKNAEPDEARLIAAAPDMARAILGLLETAKHGILTEDKCNSARSALVKAGVPLP